MKCILCDKEISKLYNEDGEIIWEIGNNAQPIIDGRCCDDCNKKLVIPKRIELAKGNKK